jgi:hypothetical protein
LEGIVAQTVKIVLIDDLDGSPAEETVQFGLDGRDYEIDLSADHARELRDGLEVYVRRARAQGPPSPRHDATEIRLWASQNGYDVAQRGRIHQHVLDAYARAHP